MKRLVRKGLPCMRARIQAQMNHLCGWNMQAYTRSALRVFGFGFAAACCRPTAHAGRVYEMRNDCPICIKLQIAYISEHSTSKDNDNVQRISLFCAPIYQCTQAEQIASIAFIARIHSPPQRSQPITNCFDNRTCSLTSIFKQNISANLTIHRILRKSKSCLQCVIQLISLNRRV